MELEVQMSFQGSHTFFLFLLKIILLMLYIPPTKCRILARPFRFLAIVIPLWPEIANFSTKYFILNKVYTAEDGIPLLCSRPILI